MPQDPRGSGRCGATSAPTKTGMEMNLDKTIIRNCDVIDGMGNEVQRDMDVVIEGNRIESVAPARPSDSNHGVLSMDGSGKTLMPGLIDAHTHMTYGESQTQEEQDIFTSVENRTLRAAWNVQKVLSA